MSELQYAKILRFSLSALCVSLFGCHAPGMVPSSSDAIFLKLHDDTRILLTLAKEKLAKGEDFNIVVNGKNVVGYRCFQNELENTHTNRSIDRIVFLLYGQQEHAYEGLTGTLEVSKADETHVNVLFRAGAPQLHPSPIGICIDNYDLGSNSLVCKEMNLCINIAPLPHDTCARPSFHRTRFPNDDHVC